MFFPCLPAPSSFLLFYHTFRSLSSFILLIYFKPQKKAAAGVIFENQPTADLCFLLQ